MLHEIVIFLRFHVKKEKMNHFAIILYYVKVHLNLKVFIKSGSPAMTNHIFLIRTFIAQNLRLVQSFLVSIKSDLSFHFGTLKRSQVAYSCILTIYYLFALYLFTLTAIINPLWMYGIYLSGMTYATNIKKVLRFQYKILRVITGAP